MKINVITSIQLSIFLIIFYSGMNDADDQTSAGTTVVKRKHEENTQEEPKKAVNICKIMAYSVTAARKAAEIIRKVMNSNTLDEVTKDNAYDFQTRADRDGQICIISSLQKHLPGLTIIGEENGLTYDVVPNECIFENPEQEIFNMKCPIEYDNVQADRVTVWVDPLDGTYGYVDGLNDHVTTLIGIVVDSKPVAGVIYQPFWDNNKGRAIWGVVGDSIHGLTVTRPPTIDDENPAIIVTTTGNPGDALEEFMHKLEKKKYKINPVGGSGNKVLYLLEGKAHGYVLPCEGPKRWDTAAPEALLKVAGADLTNIYGLHYHYGKKNEENPMDEYGIVANSPGYSHQELINEIANILQEMKHQLNMANEKRQEEESKQTKNK